MTDNNSWAAKYEAPDGQVWVCGACGKQASNKAEGGERSYGWDVSCFMNAVLCYDEPDAGTKGHPWRAVENAAQADIE